MSANFLFDDPDIPAQEATGAHPDILLQTDQQIGAGIGNMAAQNDELRIEDMQEARQSRTEPADRFGDDGLRQFVPSTRGLEDGPAGGGLRLLAKNASQGGRAAAMYC